MKLAIVFEAFEPSGEHASTLPHPETAQYNLNSTLNPRRFIINFLRPEATLRGTFSHQKRFHFDDAQLCLGWV